jgi:hypothetical protein
MLRQLQAMATSALDILLQGPLSAVRAAMDTVMYAQAFVTHSHRHRARLRTDDDERDLILQEELGTQATQPSAAHSVEPPTP